MERGERVMGGGECRRKGGRREEVGVRGREIENDVGGGGGRKCCGRGGGRDEVGGRGLER